MIRPHVRRVLLAIAALGAGFMGLVVLLSLPDVLKYGIGPARLSHFTVEEARTLNGLIARGLNQLLAATFLTIAVAVPLTANMYSVKFLDFFLKDRVNAGVLGLVVATVVLLATGLLLIVAGRRTGSRLLDPEAFRLDPRRPEHLIGRAEDVRLLLEKCEARPLMFLVGDSGSGKSAMLQAGLMPAATADGRLLPVYLDMADKGEDFSDYVWSFVDNKPVVNQLEHWKKVQAKTPLSEEIAKDMKKRGFKFCGPVIVYAVMQAMGMVNDHEVRCPRYKEIQKLEKARKRA